MKATYGVEAIGLNLDQEAAGLLVLLEGVTRAVGIPDGVVTGREDRQAVRQHTPWLAEITGPDRRYGWARSFLPARRDHADANSVGSRGVWFWWVLESGRYYECHCWPSWGGSERRYLRVDDSGDVVHVEREEVDRWLSDRSASTS